MKGKTGNPGGRMSKGRGRNYFKTWPKKGEKIKKITAKEKKCDRWKSNKK